MDKFPDTKTLEAMPVITVGQADNLHWQETDVFDFEKVEIWLGRCGIESGEPYENTVTFIGYRNDMWYDLFTYDGDDPASVYYNSSLDIQFEASELTL